jgi:hypothetical protein
MGIAPRGAANRVHFQQVVIEMLGFAFQVVVKPSFARSAGDGMNRVVVVVCEPPSAYREDTGTTQRQGSIARHYEPGSNPVRFIAPDILFLTSKDGRENFCYRGVGFGCESWVISEE